MQFFFDFLPGLLIQQCVFLYLNIFTICDLEKPNNFKILDFNVDLLFKMIRLCVSSVVDNEFT